MKRIVLLLVLMVGAVSCSQVQKGATICESTTSVSTSTTATASTTSTEIMTAPPYSERDAVLMAQVIHKEASSSYDGKLAVASVILNRSKIDHKPVFDVIFEPEQFSVADNLGFFTDEDYQAAVDVLINGSANNAYYFDGCHEDGLNHFRDINDEYIGAW